MTDINCRRTWFHGSQQKLTLLRAGSSITQNRDVAKAFSHRPSKVAMSYGGDGEPEIHDWKVRHDGVTPGFLYVVSDEIASDDVRPHPHPANASRFEWLTKGELRLELIEETVVTDSERMTDEEIAALERKQREKGELTFAESSE